MKTAQKPILKSKLLLLDEQEENSLKGAEVLYDSPEYSVMAQPYITNISPNTTQILTEETTNFQISKYEFSVTFFGESYSKIHGYVSIIVCLVSIIVNFVNVIVLTRKNMISTTNTLLTGIAVVDIFKMIFYIVFALKFSLFGNLEEDKTLEWAIFLFIHNQSTLVLHATSTWINVLLAIFRYLVVCHQGWGQKITIQTTNLAITFTSIFSIIMYIPNYICLKVVEKDVENTQGARIFANSTNSSFAVLIGKIETNFKISSENLTKIPKRYYDTDYLLDRSILCDSVHIIHGPFLKLFACGLIAFPTVKLVFTLKSAVARHKKLIGPTPSLTGIKSGQSNYSISEANSLGIKSSLSTNSISSRSFNAHQIVKGILNEKFSLPIPISNFPVRPQNSIPDITAETPTGEKISNFDKMTLHSPSIIINCAISVAQSPTSEAFPLENFSTSRSNTISMADGLQKLGVTQSGRNSISPKNARISQSQAMIKKKLLQLKPEKSKGGGVWDHHTRTTMLLLVVSIEFISYPYFPEKFILVYI